MKAIYLLFVVLTDSQGYEAMNAVSNVEHKDKLSCIVEKAQHKDLKDKISYFCGDSRLYFNKEQKFY